MGDYSFDRFNPRDFEHMVQAISRKILGNGTIIFGDGPDGQREATFDGKCPFPSETEQWDGYWVVQAKFKQSCDKDDDYTWLRSQIKSELDKYRLTKRRKIKIPNNYIFFTNIRLTPVHETGIRDKIEEFCDVYRKKVISNIRVFGYHDLCRFLDDSRDIATSYASFVLPGDILNELFKLVKGINIKVDEDSYDLLGRFLEKEFKDDMFSRLEQGGQLTDDKVNIEKVFIDLDATEDGTISDSPEEDNLKFINRCISNGDFSLKPENDPEENKFVLIGSAGQGKSTLSQFLCQIYRAYFLCQIDKCKPIEYIKKFINDYCEMDIKIPQCYRYPFRIILKDYSSWLSLKKNEKAIYSVISYLKYRLETKGDGVIKLDCIRHLLRTLSFVFVFDGLDEVPISSNRNEVLEEINSFIDVELRRENCDALIIATTRPQGYTREFDDTKYNHLHITDLTEMNCMKYLERLMLNIESSQEQRDKYLAILNSALKDDVIGRLMKTPLQATILAILVRSGGEPPRNRYNLFTDYYQTILKREKQKAIVKILNEYPDYIEDIHFKLGYKLQLLSEDEKNPSSNISFSDFECLLKEYLLDDMGLEKIQVDKYAMEIMQAITHRLVFITEIEDGKVGFCIRSIQEFFAANYYLRNQPPEVIPKKLKMISHSAYWRNTFLFVLGYIYRHKEYLVDNIDSICGELNGSNCEFGKRNGKNISMIGSWLALDILVEGTFSCKPKDGNKFIRYLKYLFQISPNQNHSYLSKLPTDIIEKTLLNLIEKYLSEVIFSRQLSAWVISGHLLKHGFSKVIPIMDKYWPNSIENINLLIKILFSIGMESNDWYLEKLINELNKIDIKEFQWSLHSILSKSSQKINGNINNSTRRLLISYVFLRVLNRQNTKYGLISIDIINNLSEIKINTKIIHRYRIIDAVQFRINITNEFVFSFKSISIINIDLLKEFDEIFKLYNLKILNLFTEFITNPHKRSLLNFLNEYMEQRNNDFEYSVRAFQKSNWILNKLFALFPNKQLLNKAIDYVESGNLGDISDWIRIEEKIKNQPLTKDFIAREMSSIGNFNFILEKEESFYKFREYCVSNDGYQEYNGFFGFQLLCAFNKIYEDDYALALKILKKDNILNELLELCYCDEYRKERYDYDLWIFLISFASNQKIIELSSKNHENWFCLENDYIYYYEDDDNKEYLLHAYEKILKVVLTLESETSILRALPYILLSQNSGDTNRFLIDKFDLSYLHNSICNNKGNEVSRILICLLDKNMTIEKSSNLVEAIRNIKKDRPILFKHVISLFKMYRIKSRWVEDFLSDVYCLIDCNNVENQGILSEYELYIKNMIEAYSSELT